MEPLCGHKEPFTGQLRRGNRGQRAEGGAGARAQTMGPWVGWAAVGKSHQFGSLKQEEPATQGAG